jgi:hypothetical protein
VLAYSRRVEDHDGEPSDDELMANAAVRLALRAEALVGQLQRGDYG